MSATRTKLLELAVVILLATGGICVAVAVYEAQSKHDAAPWWTAAAAALIAAILLPAIFLGIRPFFVGLRKRSTAHAPAPAQEGWISPEELGEYLANINQTMAEHGFGKNPNVPPAVQPTEPTPDWEALNDARVRRYQENRGLFLAHEYWTPAQEEGQAADVHIWLLQHGDGPLSRTEVKAVEYTLGPKFTNHSIVCMNARDSFGMNCSMWAPMLCIAKVYFTDGSPPLLLERYINFQAAEPETMQDL